MGTDCHTRIHAQCALRKYDCWSVCGFSLPFGWSVTTTKIAVMSSNHQPHKRIKMFRTLVSCYVRTFFLQNIINVKWHNRAHKIAILYLNIEKKKRKKKQKSSWMNWNKIIAFDEFVFGSHIFMYFLCWSNVFGGERLALMCNWCVK